jgi:tetratricopeptide (TPR) repeat protein
VTSRRFGAGLGAVAAAAVAVHAGTLRNGFTVDDPSAILNNRLVTGRLAPLALLRHDFWGYAPGERMGAWRPLPSLDFWLDWHVGGGRPWLFHLTNVLWHALASVLLALAVRRRLGSARLGVLAGLLFAVLAVGTEAVAGIVSRADLMAAAFGFAAWALFDRPLAAAACALAALLSKESAIALLPTLWIADALANPADARRLGARAAPLVAALTAGLGLRTLLFASPTAIVLQLRNNPLIAEGPIVRLWSGLRLTWLALQVIVLPLNLSVDYSYAELLPSTSPFSVEVLGGAAILALGLGGAIWLRRRDPPSAAALALLFLPWLAVSSIVVPSSIIFAERLLYVPAAGAALVVARLVERARRRSAAVIMALLVVGNAARSVVRETDWRSGLTLFSAAVQVTPGSARAWNGYAVGLLDAGRREDAIAAWRRTLDIAPRWALPRALLGSALDEQGDRQAAVRELELAVRLEPGDPEAVRRLALFLARHGHAGDAASLLRRLLAQQPGAAAARELLETIERREGP